MVFVRTKNIKGNTYAYLVENTWTTKGSRQKNTKYLGRVFFIQKVSEQLGKLNDSNTPKKRLTLLRNVVVANLSSYGFKLKNSHLKKDKIVIDLDKLSVRRNSKPIVLAINEGFLCDETLKNIANYEKSEDLGKEGYLLAKYCVEAGLIFPEKVFIAFYEASPDQRKDSA